MEVSLATAGEVNESRALQRGFAMLSLDIANYNE